MRVAGADDPFVYALSQFRAEADAAERDAERGYHRALVDWAMDRITYGEIQEAADVALAHAAARLIAAGNQLARAYEKPPS